MLGFICCVSGVASATSDVIVYPKEDQSKDQQEKDEFECYKWAKERTGYDPSKPASGSTAEKAEEPAKGDAAAAGGLGSLSGKGGALGAGVAAAGGGTQAAAIGGSLDALTATDEVEEEEVVVEVSETSAPTRRAYPGEPELGHRLSACVIAAAPRVGPEVSWCNAGRWRIRTTTASQTLLRTTT